MNKDRFFDLAERYSRNECSEEEKNLFESFYANMQKNPKNWDLWDIDQKEKKRLTILQSLNRRLDIENENAKKKVKNKRSFIWRIAASISVISVLTWLYFNYGEEKNEISFLTRSTLKGQKATVKLPDGSTVRINAKSSITYPESFTKDLREVKLVGEAYFEVEEDKNRPFVVTSYQIQTTVLGTSFNINAYDSLAISVALTSGRVNVHRTDQEKSAIPLIPGEGAFYDALSDDISVQAFDHKALTAWKDGIIYISDASYNEVFDQLARWYGVEFRFKNQPSITWAYSGEFKDMSLELVLNAIGDSGGFRYQILKNIVIVEFIN